MKFTQQSKPKELNQPIDDESFAKFVYGECNIADELDDEYFLVNEYSMIMGLLIKATNQLVTENHAQNRLISGLEERITNLEASTFK